ncbi:MAG: hypothetical protein IT480_04320 [Gammaproteobacteria bacterium]|nr:hypothetical protein [Gammaproteobacteria bacterium]
MIEASHPGAAEDCLCHPPTVVRIGTGDRHAAVVALSSTGLVRARAEGLQAITALAMARTALIDAAAADTLVRFTTQAAIALPSQVDQSSTLDALLGRADWRDPLVVATLMPSTHTVHQILHVPHDLGWFVGHFPGEPVLPGVVQLRWAVAAAGRLLGMAAGPGSIRQLKFKSPIRPGCLLDLALTRTVDVAVVTFAFRSASGEHSCGRLHY